MTAQKILRPAAVAARPGRRKKIHTKSTTEWLCRQVIKTTLPWIAAILTSTRYTNRKSRFLDRLLVRMEGGGHDL